VTRDKQGHDEIKYVQQPPPRVFDDAPEFTKPLLPLRPSEPTTFATRPDPSTGFKEPFKVTLKPWRDDPPVTLFVLKPDGSVDLGLPVDSRTLWVAMQGDNGVIAIVTACLSEVARLRLEVDDLKKQTKRNRRKP